LQLASFLLTLPLFSQHLGGYLKCICQSSLRFFITFNLASKDTLALPFLYLDHALQS
jgi:hypothetical protein